MKAGDFPSFFVTFARGYSLALPSYDFWVELTMAEDTPQFWCPRQKPGKAFDLFMVHFDPEN